jgi:hypothetical protein
MHVMHRDGARIALRDHARQTMRTEEKEANRKPGTLADAPRVWNESSLPRDPQWHVRSSAKTLQIVAAASPPRTGLRSLAGTG